MADPAGRELEQAKAARNAAHKAFRLQLTQINEDLAARGIGGRIVDRAGEAMVDAAEVANEHKGIVAGTLAALAVWLLRHRLIHWLSGLWGDPDKAEVSDETERNTGDD